MTDLTALAQKLASLRASDDLYENGARVISQGGVPSGLSALIRAIDDTVLDRKLEIMTGGHIVSLIVSGRRLRGISAVVPPKGKSARLVGESLSRDDARTLEAVHTLMSELLTPAPRITLRSLPSEPFGNSGDRGVAATELAKLWNIDLDEEPLPPMERFLRTNSAAFSAFLHVNGGEVIASDGDADALRTILEEQIEGFLATKAKLSGNVEGPQLFSFEGALEGGKSVALGMAEDEMALLVYDPAALGHMHASWQAIFK